MRTASPSGVAWRNSGPEYSIFSPYARARAASARRAPTVCLSAGCTLSGSPMSVVTTIAVFVTESARRCASRMTAHTSLSFRFEVGDLHEKEREIALVPLHAPIGDKRRKDLGVHGGERQAAVRLALVPDDALDRVRGRS